MDEIKCRFCGKCIKNKGALATHEPYCKSNPNKIKRCGPGMGGWPKGKLNPFKGKKAIERYGAEQAAEISKKISEALKGKPWNCAEETNKKRIEKIKETAKKYGRIGGLRHGSGRGKKGWYKGYWCDSSWELAYVIYNIEHNISFKRNNDSFIYSFNNKEHKYLPDFILEDGTYVEVKGYYTEQVKNKIKQFPKDNKLIIIDENGIKKYINYAVSKYGKDFIKLYNQI